MILQSKIARSQTLSVNWGRTSGTPVRLYSQLVDGAATTVVTAEFPAAVEAQVEKGKPTLSLINGLLARPGFNRLIVQALPWPFSR
jgi:hypothetical protein